MTDEMHTIVFTPSGRRGSVATGISVLDAARSLGVDVDSVCGGRGICGRCQVEVGSQPGMPALTENLTAPGPIEVDYHGKRPLVAGRRLGCVAHVSGDIVIDVPPDSQVHRQVVRKRAGVINIPVDPVVRLYYLEVSEPDMYEPAADLRRLIRALETQWSVTGVRMPSALLPSMQDALRAGGWTVTIAIHDGTDITAIWPGFHDVSYGVAFDVGSTTIAGHLCDLASGAVLASAGVMNPQIRYGEDLMSRVSYVMMNPGGEESLTRVVREALNGLIEELATEADVDKYDILEVTLVGNPIMHHLVLGIDPTPLGGAPFALATDEAVRTPAANIDLDLRPGARLYVLPCIAGHVGADTAGAILSEGPHRRPTVQLLIDVGTNAEIVLGSADRLLAASSPTGPAFEGAQISSGQRAAPGAIERIRIDRDTLEPRYKVIGSETWSDEPGFEEEIAATGVTGICGSGIIEAIAELHLAGVISTDGVISGSNPRIVEDYRTWSYVVRDVEPRIVITQADVRAIQLAKAALYAGVKLLMNRLGVDSVDEIRLAGAFGSHIDPKYAMALGMFPDCDLDRVSSAGNAAGTGALMALLSGKERAEIERIVRKVDKIETAVEPRFQEHFVNAMGIPHTYDDFPELSRVLDLPARSVPTRNDNRRRRRRQEEAG